MRWQAAVFGPPPSLLRYLYPPGAFIAVIEFGQMFGLICAGPGFTHGSVTG